MDINEYMQRPDVGTGDLITKSGDMDWVQTDKEGMAFIKVLWTSPESGGWAVLYKWLKGYVAPAHKHLGSIHDYLLSGRLQVGDKILEPGDYLVEANGMIHGNTVALEDTVHLNIADGPILFFRDGGFTHYVGWEQMHRLKARYNGG